MSDLDGTLTGHEEGIRALAELGHEITLVVNSSRPRTSVQATLDQLPTRLPVTALITAMGTEIMVRGEDCARWSRRFEGWDRAPIDAFMEKVGILPHLPGHQAKYKASYHVPADRWEQYRRSVLALEPDSVVVTSGDSDFDVLPAGAGKEKAAAWLAGLLGYAPDKMIVAGDSGNDVAMFNAASMAIAVSNSRRELVERVDPRRTYFAKGPSALGVLEGLRHWGALPVLAGKEAR
ncbi:HAD family hydrolase [Luteolibacter flavescens]|uniref:HAD family hydrolase n=1 Tax=Luteolibacter flavescens TaxID=1859460 RepID=A0ABT3FUN2_9BACT|nr:HAD family hydrolase [Luteolibacter flavescens]MCW1887300.1 HAD family hydrolase [Luteolibacter flavescens]